MLLQFSVENFRSFKEQAILSMEASPDQAHKDHLFIQDKKRILKTASIFGPNASGKTSFFKAITAAILLIRNSNVRQLQEPLLEIMPFLFSEESAGKPSSFEFTFLTNGTKYVYGFSATRQRIIEEYLYKFHTSRASVIFERTYNREKNKDDYHFTKAQIKKELDPLTDKNTANKLFLATATAWNSEVTREPFLWFNKIDTFTPKAYETLINIAGPLYEKDKESGKLHEFMCKVLHEADINVSNYELKSHDLDKEEFLRIVPPQMKNSLPVSAMGITGKAYEIFMIHEISGESGEKKEYSLPANYESQGTQNLFLFSPILKQAFDEGRIICVDEFDASLHPMLVIFLINLFNNPEINKNNAQLIISTHTTDLLSLKLSRRDEIYFVQKDQQTGASELYSLSDFATRKLANEDIRNSYYLGKYGAVPNVGDGEIFW